MIIQMIYQMSGGRYDDRSWPLPWHDFEVPDEEGRGLIRAGAAMEVVGSVSPPPASNPDPEPKSEPEPAKPAAAAAPAPMAKSAIIEVMQPLPSDPKAAWVEYAVSRGVSQTEAEAMTKAQLQAEHGGRM